MKYYSSVPHPSSETLTIEWAIEISMRSNKTLITDIFADTVDVLAQDPVLSRPSSSHSYQQSKFILMTSWRSLKNFVTHKSPPTPPPTPVIKFCPKLKSGPWRWLTPHLLCFCILFTKKHFTCLKNENQVKKMPISSFFVTFRHFRPPARSDKMAAICHLEVLWLMFAHFGTK